MICDVCTGKGHCRGGNTRVSSKIRLLSASWGTEICQFTMSGNQEFAGIKVDDPFETNQWMEGLMEVGSCMGGISSWKVFSCISCHIHTMPWDHLLRQDLRINPQFSKDKQDTSSRAWSFFLRVLRVICVLITSKTPIMCSWLVPTGAIIQNRFASLHRIKYRLL